MFQPGSAPFTLARTVRGASRTHCRGEGGTGFRDSISKVRQAGGAFACRKNPGNTMILDPCFDLGNALPFALNFKPQRIGILLQLEGT